jgi:hypothetical protein
LVSCGFRLKNKEEAATIEIVTKYPEKIKGILSTFDRIIFRGHLTCFYRQQTQNYFLHSFRYKVTKKGTRIMSSILKIKKLEIPEMELAL